MSRRKAGKALRRTQESADGLAAEACANRRSGGCLGAAVDGSFAMPMARCLLRLGLPCGYFERQLLGSALRPGSGLAAVRADYAEGLARDLGAAIDRIEDEEERWRVERHPFSRHSPGWDAAEVEENWCECGEPMGRGRRVCDQCRGERRKATKRRAQRRWRDKATA